MVQIQKTHNSQLIMEESIEDTEGQLSEVNP